MNNTVFVAIDLQNEIAKNYKKIIGQVNKATYRAEANVII